MTSRRLGAVAGVAFAVATLLLTACGDPDHVYVSDEDTGVFLQLPQGWTVFEVEDGNANVNPRTDASSGEWAVIIDGSEDPRRSHLEDPAAADPVGRASVLNITTTQIPRTHAALRSLLTVDGSDPLENPSADLRIEAYDEIEISGAWGYRMVIAHSPGPGIESKIVQLAFFDDGGNRLMTLALGCSAECYDDHGDEIQAVVDTFTIEGPE
jgi:hypothetical protein